MSDSPAQGRIVKSPPQTTNHLRANSQGYVLSDVVRVDSDVDLVSFVVGVLRCCKQSVLSRRRSDLLADTSRLIKSSRYTSLLELSGFADRYNVTRDIWTVDRETCGCCSHFRKRLCLFSANIGDYLFLDYSVAATVCAFPRNSFPFLPIAHSALSCSWFRCQGYPSKASFFSPAFYVHMGQTCQLLFEALQSPIRDPCSFRTTYGKSFLSSFFLDLLPQFAAPTFLQRNKSSRGVS